MIATVILEQKIKIFAFPCVNELFWRLVSVWLWSFFKGGLKSIRFYLPKINMLKGNYFVGIALGMNLEKKSVLEIEVTQTINNRRVVVSIHKI